jgi:hypothetical protein
MMMEEKDKGNRRDVRDKGGKVDVRNMKERKRKERYSSSLLVDRLPGKLRWERNREYFGRRADLSLTGLPAACLEEAVRRWILLHLLPGPGLSLVAGFSGSSTNPGTVDSSL